MKICCLLLTLVSKLITEMDIIRKMRWNNSETISTWEVPYEVNTNWQEEVKLITDGVCKLSSEPEEYFKSFANDQLALFVYDSNRMEGTIPVQHITGSTIKKIKSFLAGDINEPDVTAWCSEGGRILDSGSSDRQLYQCAKAVQFLLVENRFSPLSVELIIQTHRIMMENSFQKESKITYDIEVGKLRSTEVSAGTYQFLPFSVITEATNKLVELYESKREKGHHPIDLATLLFYELITIHPFQNGNGRLSRMFFAWSLMRDGYPFVTSLSSGHKRRSQHYLRAILRARHPYHGTRGELNVLAVLSIQRSLGNYLTDLPYVVRSV